MWRRRIRLLLALHLSGAALAGGATPLTSGSVRLGSGAALGMQPSRLTLHPVSEYLAHTPLTQRAQVKREFELLQAINALPKSADFQLPHLPFHQAGRPAGALRRLVARQFGGLAYLTLQTATSPANPGEVVYIFHGLSHDGKWYLTGQWRYADLPANRKRRAELTELARSQDFKKQAQQLTTQLDQEAAGPALTQLNGWISSLTWRY